MTAKLSIIRHIPVPHITAAAIFFGVFIGLGSSFMKKIHGRMNTSIVDAVAPKNKT